MRRLMIDRFLSEDYECKMHIEHKQDDAIVQNYEPIHVNNVFDECLQPKHDDLLDVGDK